jgi:hypothetical protein
MVSKNFKTTLFWMIIASNNFHLIFNYKKLKKKNILRINWNYSFKKNNNNNILYKKYRNNLRWNVDVGGKRGLLDRDTKKKWKQKQA